VGSIPAPVPSPYFPTGPLIDSHARSCSFAFACSQPPINIITDTPVASWPYMAVLYIVQATVCKNTWFLLPTTFTLHTHTVTPCSKWIGCTAV